MKIKIIITLLFCVIISGLCFATDTTQYKIKFPQRLSQEDIKELREYYNGAVKIAEEKGLDKIPFDLTKEDIDEVENYYSEWERIKNNPQPEYDSTRADQMFNMYAGPFSWGATVTIYSNLGGSGCSFSEMESNVGGMVMYQALVDGNSEWQNAYPGYFINGQTIKLRVKCLGTGGYQYIRVKGD